jgi:hypothetical protein
MNIKTHQIVVDFLKFVDKSEEKETETGTGITGKCVSSPPCVDSN